MRLAILLLPSAEAEQWSAAFRTAAQAAGWSYLTSISEASESGPAILATVIAAEIEAFTPDHRTVIHAPLPALIAHLDQGLEASTLRAAAFHLSRAAEIATLADQVIMPGERQVTLPGLGTVKLTGDAPCIPSAPIEVNPLAIYETLPPPTGSRAEWPLRLFEIPEAVSPSDNATPRLDISGLNRVFVFGPYIDLPPGRWAATFGFTLDTQGSSVPLHFEWGPDGDSTIAQERIRQPGVYEITLAREWTTPNPAEFRIYTQHPVFSGMLEPIGCEIHRVG